MKTSIIATLGPASEKAPVVRKMISNGLDIVRLNFSHGTYEEHFQKISLIKNLNKKMRRHIKIMQDLEGYRIRLGRIKEPIELEKKEEFRMVQKNTAGGRGVIPFDYKGPLKAIKKGSNIFIDDGKIMLEVISSQEAYLRVRVIMPGTLKERKGVNIPELKLDFDTLTVKDRKDLDIAIKHRFDYIAQSFVTRAKDVMLIKEKIKPHHPECLIFAKIENQEALNNIDEIIDEADGVMVARGDLGICIPIYKVPVVQKEVIKKCLVKKKPVCVATQMLDSMTEHPFPTRAEVSDVANAILDGAAHLLLSGETAVGKYPDKTVGMMNMIIKNTELYRDNIKSLLE